MAAVTAVYLRRRYPLSPFKRSRRTCATLCGFRDAPPVNVGYWARSGLQWMGRACPLCPSIQTSTCTAIASASSTSIGPEPYVRAAQSTSALPPIGDVLASNSSDDRADFDPKSTSPVTSRHAPPRDRMIAQHVRDVVEPITFCLDLLRNGASNHLDPAPKIACCPALRPQSRTRHRDTL